MRRRQEGVLRGFFARAVLGLALLGLLGCGHGEDPQEMPVLPASQKSRLCRPMKASSAIPERRFLGQRFGGSISFAELRDSVSSSCKDCHMAPNNAKGVSYVDSYRAEERTIGGSTKVYPGLFEMAEDFRAAIENPDSDTRKQMPPADRRGKNPEGFLRIGRMLGAWIAAGKPEGSFSLQSDADGNGPLPLAPLVDSSELGDCVPAPEAMGFDYRRDRMFAEAAALPKTLIDTDLFSLDAFELAQRGTVAYNVEYPLWADNAEKGRWVHVPMKLEGNALLRQPISFNGATKSFEIPENTRFYKMFYKLVKDAQGKPRYRRVETRLIVVRYPLDRALFGTYRWDETEQVATLVETPYRDGTAWKDVLFQVVTDEKKGRQRNYAIPARHRCVECHMGDRSFVLGFTPLQINRRAPGEYARNQNVTADELSQADRLAAYGVVKGYQRAEELPRLEWIATSSPRNIFELKAQAYAVGNCAHCHNPTGFAKASGVDLDFTPGALFGFNTHTRAQGNPGRYIVSASGDPDRSFLYNKVADPPSQQGILSRMPMHTPGSPDCAALSALGKWIRSFESIDAARDWEPECKSAPDNFDWIPQDFTWPKSEHYVPRRNDWNDPQNGMPAAYRDLELTPALQEKVSRTYAVGYWNEKDECRFPAVDLPPEKQRPWMIDDQGQPKYPFGQVYYTTPGSWFFRTTCVKCHGPGADGNTALARGILNWSGGDVRVANLIEGLFGNRNANQSVFEVPLPGGGTKNLAGNYLIWMAMEGTRVKFPPEASNFIGKHGAQMLNRIRDNCLRQISPEKSSSPNYPEHEIYREICFHDNWPATDPRLRFDPDTAEPVNPEAVDQWLDKAAFNAGWAIFQYLQDAGSGNWRPGNDECEKVFPKNGGAFRWPVSPR